jgi:hypothetical protein
MSKNGAGRLGRGTSGVSLIDIRDLTEKSVVYGAVPAKGADAVRRLVRVVPGATYPDAFIQVDDGSGVSRLPRDGTVGELLDVDTPHRRGIDLGDLRCPLECHRSAEGHASVEIHLEPQEHPWPNGAAGDDVQGLGEEDAARQLVEPLYRARLPVPRASWTGRWFSPRGDRWWRVWACPDHIEGLTGLREFGRQR